MIQEHSDVYDAMLYGPVKRAALLAVIGNDVCLYVRTIQRGKVRMHQVREYLDKRYITYESSERTIRFPRTGGSLRFAVLEPEMRGFAPDCIFLDNLR